MGDRAHLRRQGNMRKLEERDETFPGNTAYSAVPNDRSESLKRSVLRKERGSNGTFTLSTINLLKKAFPAELASPAKPFLNSQAESGVVALFIDCRWSLLCPDAHEQSLREHGGIDRQKKYNAVHRRNNFFESVAKQISDRTDLFSLLYRVALRHFRIPNAGALRVKPFELRQNCRGGRVGRRCCCCSYGPAGHLLCFGICFVIRHFDVLDALDHPKMPHHVHNSINQKRDRLLLHLSSSSGFGENCWSSFVCGCRVAR